MSGANGHHRRYTVEMLGRARDEYLDILRRADAVDRGSDVSDAYRNVLSRLASDPRGFGEPLYDLRKMRMQVLRGTVPPLYVEYGVHDDTPLVVIRRIVWLADRP
jgi:hypothetical protein